MNYNKGKQKQEDTIGTALSYLTGKVGSLEATLQQVLDNHIKEPEQEEAVTIGGNTYYKATLHEAACKYGRSIYSNNLTRFIVDYPDVSKNYMIKPTKDKPDIIQGDDPRPAFKYKGKYYSQYLLKRAENSTSTPEEFINEYPNISADYEVEYSRWRHKRSIRITRCTTRQGARNDNRGNKKRVLRPNSRKRI